MTNRSRRIAALAVGLAHLAVAILLLRGGSVEVATTSGPALVMIDVPPVPPLAPVAVKAGTQRSEGAASRQPPAIRKATVAPSSPISATTVSDEPRTPTPAATATGDGSGSGEAGIAGLGLGNSGTGPGGGGGGVTRARLIAGAIRNADYPRTASRGERGGTVVAFFDVDEAGQPQGCRIVRSSGDPDLDATTCRLIVERFRYEPARDPYGRAVPDVMGWEQRWWLEPRR